MGFTIVLVDLDAAWPSIVSAKQSKPEEPRRQNPFLAVTQTHIQLRIPALQACHERKTMMVPRTDEDGNNDQSIN
jgi:hypothetical protein